MRSSGSDYIRFTGIGITIVLILVVFGTIGFLGDSELGTLPLFLIVGLVIGFAGGLYYLYRSLEKLGKL